jgi:hypothetical protein
MESSLTRKRKANEIDDDYDMDKVWGCGRQGREGSWSYYMVIGRGIEADGNFSKWSKKSKVDGQSFRNIELES